MHCKQTKKVLIFFLISLLIFSNFSTAFAGVKTISYGYDTSGNRVSKTDGAKTSYYFSQYYEIEDGKERKRVYSNNTLVATIENGNIHYVSADHLGGSSTVTNKDGNMEQMLDYYPFGGIRINDQYGFDEKKKFTGHEHDDETGLEYMKARYYDSGAGRFMSVDPVYLAIGNSKEIKSRTGKELRIFLQNPQELNAYSYVANNPLRMIDPNGEGMWDVVTGKQSWSSYVVEIGQGGEMLAKNSAVARTIMDHPYASGAVIGVVGGLSAYGISAGVTYGLTQLGIIGATQTDKVIDALNNSDNLLNNDQRQAISDSIQNTKLNNIFNQLYKASDKLPGGTAGAIEYTNETGNLVGGSDHMQKGIDYIKGLQNVLQNTNLSNQDKAIAQTLVNQLSDALNKVKN